MPPPLGPLQVAVSAGGMAQDCVISTFDVFAIGKCTDATRSYCFMCLQCLLLHLVARRARVEVVQQYAQRHLVQVLALRTQHHACVVKCASGSVSNRRWCCQPRSLRHTCGT